MGLPIDHKALFDAMPVPRLLVQVEGRKFTVIEANRRALEYFNRKIDQIVDQSVDAFMDSENARLFEQSFEVCVKQKMPVTIQALPNFPGGIRVHGFWINPLFDATGSAIILDVMAQPDSADDSILQRERDDAISLLTSIFDASEIGIIVTDRQQRIVRVNDSFVRTFGWSRDQLIGEPFMDFVPDESEPGLEDIDSGGFLERGTRSSGEVKLLRSDGTIANALYTSASLELSQRRRFQVTTIMDISLRKQMEISLRVSKDQADAANHAKSAFLANMSHELRTPLNAIIGFSEIMMNETFGPLGTPKYKEYLSDVHLSARHLLEIINEVLDMSKIEAGKVELDEQIFDVGELVQSVSRMMTSRAFSANIDLQTEIAAELPLLRADARLIRQVLINLVSNAIKFSLKGGKISTKVDMHADGDLRITVTDQGIGIPRDKIREALEPFGQIVDSNLAKEQQGTGLGLPLAKAMVELHGGMLDLQSETNVGTTVTVFLPSRRVVARGAGKGDNKISLQAASKIV